MTSTTRVSRNDADLLARVDDLLREKEERRAARLEDRYPQLVPVAARKPIRRSAGLSMRDVALILGTSDTMVWRWE